MLGMRRREFITLLGGAAGWPFAARAQQSAKTYRIGYLGPGAASVLPAGFNAFRQQLHQLGYVEGQISRLITDGPARGTINSQGWLAISSV
jgi:putative tryptophan/tyrosine transport system substrate-binding protein